MDEEIEISNGTAKNEPLRPRDFLLCTDPKDFAVIAKSPYNVVLQSNPKGPDDGYFSRLAAKRGFRYINLEGAIGELVKQREMLRWLERKLTP